MAELAARARFRVVDAAELEAAGEGGYDAAFIFEARHDMARPVEALAASRAETPSAAAGTALCLGCAGGPSRPGSPACASCRWTTTSGGSTS